MVEQPKVSVVVVFHNTRPFLDEAIRSVLGQSFTDWELLLVDDGSTDGSDEIAREHARRHERIRYLHHPGRENRGISAARNLGTRHARGSYVAQLDSDDVWLPTHLENQVHALEARPHVAIVYGPVERWHSWTGEPGAADLDFTARPLDEYDACIDPPDLIPIVLQRRFGVPLGFLARREAMEEVDGYEDEFRGMYDDQVFYCKLGLRHRAYVLSACTYRYRRHPDSIVWVTNHGGDQLPNRIRFLDWLERYLTDQGVDDPRVWKPLRQELWKCRHPEIARWREDARDLARRVWRKVRKVWGLASDLQRA